MSRVWRGCLPVPPAQLLWAGLLQLRELQAAGTWRQDPACQPSSPCQSCLLSGVLVASGAVGGGSVHLPAGKTQKCRRGASGFEVQRTTSSGDGHAEPQTWRGWAPAERPRASAHSVHRHGGRAGLPASTTSWALWVRPVVAASSPTEQRWERCRASPAASPRPCRKDPAVGLRDVGLAFKH